MKKPQCYTKAMVSKRSDTCVLLGSGQSINAITDESWEKIKECDMWAINNWVYHPDIVPNFYTIEVKHYNYMLMQRRLKEKAELYKHCNFLFTRDKTIKMPDGKRLPLYGVAFEGAKTFEFPIQPRDPKRTHIIFTAKYTPDEIVVTKSYDMSVTAIFEMIYRFGYKTVVVYGIDLTDSYYFWTDRPECGEVHHATNKAHEGKDPKLPHATHRIQDFIFDFNDRWMRPAGREIFVGHKETALYPGLKCRPIE